MKNQANNKPLVSIIVLLYKNYEYLQNNIQSIVIQNYNRIELIVADDCSGLFDEKQIAEMIGDFTRFERVVLYSNEKNLGTVKNYNCAIKNSTGEIIMPLSADDVFFDETIVSKVVDFFVNNNSEICYSKRIGRLTKRIYPTNADIEIINNGNADILKRMCYSGLFSGSTLYFTKDYWEENGEFDEDYFLLEDFPFSFKACLNGVKIGFLDVVSIVYGEEGLTSHNKKNSLLSKDLDLHYRNMLSVLRHRVSKKCYRYVERLKLINKFNNLFGVIISLVCYPIISFYRIKHSFYLKKGKYKENFYHFYLKY